MPIIIRHNGALNSLAEGFAAGSQGMAHGLAQRRALEQRQAEEAARESRFQQEIGLAKDKVAREEQQRAIEDQTAQALGQAQVDQMPGAAPGGMGPEDATLQHYRKIAEKLPADMLPRFSAEVQRAESSRLMLDQRERHLSALQSLAKEPGAAPFMDEEMQARIQNASELLQNAKTPEELAQILPETRKAIDATREDIAARHARAGEVEQVGGYYQQQIAQDMQNAMLERNPMVRAWKLEQLDKQRKYLGAFLTARPGSVTASQFMSRMALMDQEAPPWMQKPETAPKTESDVSLRNHFLEVWKQQHPPEVDPKTGHIVKPGAPVDEGWLSAQVYRAKGGKDPREIGNTDQEAIQMEMQGAPQPAEKPTLKILSFPKADPDTQSSLVEEIKADMQKGGQQLPAIFDKYGVDPDSLPEDVLQELLGAPKKARNATENKRASKLERVGPNF